MKTLLALCFSILLALNVNAAVRQPALEAIPAELLYDDIPEYMDYEDPVEYMDYDGWLNLYYTLGEDADRVRRAIVTRMVILPIHTGKPIPQFLFTACASAQQTARDAGLVDLRLIEVLERASGIKSISLDGSPFYGKQHGLEAMYRHADTLEQLSIKFGSDGSSFYLQEGWVQKLTNLKALEICEPRLLGIKFPEDFEPLKNLVQLDLKADDLFLPSGAFQHLSGLMSLKLQIGSLGELPLDIFEPLANLAILDLGNQRVNYINPSSFRGLVNLWKLVLPVSHFYDIAPGTFYNLGKLASVSFKTIPTGFECFEKLVANLRRELEPLGFTLNTGESEFTRPI